MGEFVGFATGRPLLAVALLLITAVCGVLRGWITHRTRLHMRPRPPSACSSRLRVRTPPNGPL